MTGIRWHLFIVFGCLAADVLASGRNIIVNADLSAGDGMGGVLGWSTRFYGDGAVSAYPTGRGAFTVEFKGRDVSHYLQYPVKLKSEGKYRISAEVRTAGLNGASVRLVVKESSFDSRKDVGTEPLPDDTAGVWRKVEWEGRISRSRNPEAYAVAVKGAGVTNGTARLEVRNFSLQPLSKEADVAVSGLPDFYLHPQPVRIVPMDPLLANVDAEMGRMLFYWAGEQAQDGACSLSASIDSGKAIVVPLGADGRAEVSFGRIAARRHRVKVKVLGRNGATLAENDYGITACEKPQNGPVGRRLNNFVTELVNASLADGEMRFFRHGRGWVWISFDGCDSAEGFLDGCAEPAVRYSRHERRNETMRDIAAGWHVLKVKGAKGGRLRIHSVKSVSTSTWRLAVGPCDFSGEQYVFTHGFARRFLMSMNTVRGAEEFLRNPDSSEPAYYAARGCAIYDRVGISAESPLWVQPDELWRKLTESGWREGYDLSVDESLMFSSRQRHVTLAETIWKMQSMRPGQRVNINWGDATRACFDDRKSQASLLAAVANTGDGRGVSLPEVYAPVLPDADGMERWLALFARQVAAIGEMVPAAKDMTQFNVSPWVDLGRWCDYPCPEADIKAHYAKLIHAFATRPEFAANSGIDAGAATAAEEELRRWIAKLFRYYAIEGGRDDLAEKYGFKWNPGLVKNCDFAEGLSGWDAVPAASGSIKVDSIPKFGRQVQGRQKAPEGVGDSFASFTAVKGKTNVLSQRLSSLERGRHYALMFCVADADTIENPRVEPSHFAFSARLEGAEELPGLRFRHVVPSRGGRKNGEAGQARTWMAVYRYVFRAKASDTTLSFCDRGDDGVALKPGARQLLNYVVFRPYYTESPEEVDEIAALIAGESCGEKEE